MLILFFLIGSISATEISNATNTESSNLMVENEDVALTDLNDSKLELSSESLEYGSNTSDNEMLMSSPQNIQTADENSTSDSSNTTTITTKIDVNNPRYSQSGTVIKVTLKDSDGNLLGNKTVSLKINSKTYTDTTNNNGVAYFTVSALKKASSYSVKINFAGDSEYEKSSLTKTIKVVSSISATNQVKGYGENKRFTAKFLKDNYILKNTNVKFTVNGKTYTVKTDSKGVAKLTASLKPGKYNIKIYNSYSKETVTKTFTVNKGPTTITGSNAYILPKTKYSYSVVLKNSRGTLLKNGKIHFTYNGKEVIKTTNANGKATLTIPALSKGTYTIKYQFKRSSNYKSTSGSKKLYVKDSTTKLKATTLKMQYNDGSVFSVKLTDSAGKAMANKTIKITLNGKTTSKTTDSTGVAKLSIGNLKPATYTVKSTYSKAGLKDYNILTSSVVISKQTASITASDLVMEYKDGSVYQITLKNKTGSVLPNTTIQFTLNGKTINVNTDGNGVAKLAISEDVGYYVIKSAVSSTYYTSSEVSKHVLVNGTKFTASDLISPPNTNNNFTVKLLDGQGKEVSGKTVKFTLNSKEQSVKTDSNGIARLSLSGLAQGTYTVSYTDGFASGTSKITIVEKVTLKQIIAASQNVKKYIEGNEALPKTVTIGSVTYSLAEYMYLASQAIINLDKNSKADISVKAVNAPASPKEASTLGNLYDYVSVAKSVVNTVNSKGTMPDSVSSKVGTIGYNGLVYATARVVAFYDDYSIMPNYVSIKTYSSTSSSSSLNSKNTITNLKAYLAASTNCQVGNSKIKSLVNSLTSGLTTDLAKARAIYNYVRDSISYSFYYNTKYGAVGTLNAKTGNCVDQAHLLIAMYRTAGLAARYAHGTCYFTLSGSTYGHVWTQVLIGDTWIVGDPTSARNSFGNVVNWNNNNYNLKGYYSSIAF